MEKSVIHIKNMVCQRCIKAVETRLHELHITYSDIQLGKVTLASPLSEDKKAELSKMLNAEGFSLLTDRSSKQIEEIKTLIIEMVHYDKEVPNINYSEFLAQELHHEYHYLSRLFSSVEGVTIEKYILQQKAERIKELLMYDELTPTEIAYKLNYSSLQHMSNQFKKVTGLSPRAFKNLKGHDRRSLDEI